MRTHSNDFKNGIKSYGRQFTDNIQSTYSNNGGIVIVTIPQDKLNRVEYSVDTQLFKSILGKLTFDTNQKLDDRCKEALYYIQLSDLYDTNITFKGIITQIEEQKDSKSYLYTCYDKMIKTMVDYETPKVNGTAITYPITIRNYLIAICSHLGITFGSSSDNFTNYNKEIKKELYVDSDGKSLGYTFRDVLDDIAEATGSFIYVDNNGILKVKSIFNTNDTINEDFFKDKNVNVGKKVGPYNVVVLSRANDSDNLYYPSNLPENPIEFKISDNLILEQDTREDFIQGIYNAVNGLEFYTNDFATNGILYYEIGDKFNVSIDGVTYPCLMLSDDIIRTTGLKENIRTTEPQQSVTPYKYASYSDKVAITSKNAKILVDKANASIEQIVEAVGDNGEVTSASIVTAINNDTSQIKLEADKIDINGVVSANNNFKIKTDGSVEINNGIIELTDTTSSGGVSKIKITGTYNNDISLMELYSNALSMSTQYNGYVIVRNIGDEGIFLMKSANDNSYSTTNFLLHNQIIMASNNNTTFEVDGTTGNTTIGGNVIVEKGSSTDNTYYRAKRTDTGADIFFGVGSGGTNRGIYDVSLNKWLFYTDGTNTICNDLTSNQLTSFNDTSGSDWKTMLKNKIDWCISNITTTKSYLQTFINGGWQGQMFGFGMFSKIGTNYQLVWFSGTGTHYVLKYGTTYTYYRSLFSSVEDSGWVNCTTSQGTWTYCQVRRIGKIVHLRAFASSLGRPNGMIFTIPSGYRPSQQEVFYASAGYSTGYSIARTYINTDGTVGMDWNINMGTGQDVTANTWKRFDYTYFVD